MITPKHRNKALYTALIVLTIASCKIVDLRKGYDKQSSSEKALSIYEDVKIAHKTNAWKKISTYSFDYTDTFEGPLKGAINPYGSNPGKGRIDFWAGTFIGRMTHQGGKLDGQQWGIQSWQTYTKQSIQSEVLFAHNKHIEFWLPTVQYFMEFPHRIDEATAWDYLGEKEFKGTKYDLLIASWNTVAPQKDIDQYIMWINKQTHRIDILEYTVRDFGKRIKAAGFYTYFEHDGLLIPKTLTIHPKLHKDNIMHTMEVANFAINEVKKEDLCPNKDLPLNTGK